MKIVAISDTHSHHRKLEIPEADVLICSGDITRCGELSIIEDFSNWLKEQPVKHRLVCFGNHELGTRNGYKRAPAIEMIRNSAHYLEESEVVIDGIKFWGSPATPFFHNWEFNYRRGPEIAAVWDKIPHDVDVLITHGPPNKILDVAADEWGTPEHAGCEMLAEKITKLKQLKLHCFGHIHPGAGMIEINGTIFVNASSCNPKYEPINKPVVIEI